MTCHARLVLLGGLVRLVHPPSIGSHRFDAVVMEVSLSGLRKTDDEESNGSRPLNYRVGGKRPTR